MTTHSTESRLEQNPYHRVPVRPYKFTYSCIKRLFRVFKDGGTTTAACAAAGLSRSRYYDALHFSPRLRQKIQQLKISRIELMEDCVFVHGMKGDMKAAIRWLEAKGGWSRPGITNINQLVNQQQQSQENDDDDDIEFVITGVDPVEYQKTPDIDEPVVP